MDLLVKKNKNNEIFTFEGGLVSKVWEAEPITRFNFKDPVENEWLKENLANNKPTAGIVFNGDAYIGTNDGMVYSPTGKTQRIPSIMVDTEIFIDNCQFQEEPERGLFKEFIKELGNNTYIKKLNEVAKENPKLIHKFFEANKKYNKVYNQNDDLRYYLDGYLGIRGFAINKNSNLEGALYDGHLLGITKTITGKLINDLTPHILHQINNNTAGFIPLAYPTMHMTKTEIKNGLIEETKIKPIDYRSLWDLNMPHKMLVEGICPRDGSGYTPAKFATDGEIIALSHGNHPSYMLDILNDKNKKTINLDPSKTPNKLLIKNCIVLGDYGNVIRNFSADKDIFTPKNGIITSLSDSGLCTVQNDEQTEIYNIFDSKKIDSLKGTYEFLDATPQS